MSEWVFCLCVSILFQIGISYIHKYMDNFIIVCKIFKSSIYLSTIIKRHITSLPLKGCLYRLFSDLKIFYSNIIFTLHQMSKSRMWQLMDSWVRALGSSQGNTISKLYFKEFESKVNEPCGRYFLLPIIFCKAIFICQRGL